MTEPLRFIVRARDKMGEPISAGDEVTTYELDEPYYPPPDVDRDWRERLGPAGGFVDLEASAREVAKRVLRECADKTKWREDKSLCQTCTCRERRVLARVYIEAATARRWLVVKSERVPIAFRRPGHGEDLAWPMVDHPSGAHTSPAVVTCKGCDKPWLILSNAREVLRIGVTRFRHGARVS